MGAVFAREAGLSVSEVSLFMATAILWGMILQFPLGRLSDRFDRLTVLVISAMATAGAAYGVIWTTGQPRPALFIASAIFGWFCFSIYPLSTSQVDDLADPDRLVQVVAGMLTGGAAVTSKQLYCAAVTEAARSEAEKQS